jgi:acyl-CoA hydrolase
MEERIKKCITRQFRLVFPCDLNDHETLFGGNAMKWMDEVAYITALRFLRHKLVTVSVPGINFLNPLKAGTIAEVVGTVNRVNGASIEIQVEIFAEEMYKINRYKAIDALFVFGVIDDNHKPKRIHHNLLGHDEEI